MPPRSIVSRSPTAWGRVLRRNTCDDVHPCSFLSFLPRKLFFSLSFLLLSPVSLSHVFFLSFSFLWARTFDGIVFPTNFPRRYEKDGDFTRESIDRAPHIDENDACNESFIPTEVTSPQSLPLSLFCILVLIILFCLSYSRCNHGTCAWRNLILGHLINIIYLSLSLFLHERILLQITIKFESREKLSLLRKLW